MVAADRDGAARLVHLRAAMRRDPGRGAPRDQLVALARLPVRLHDHARLSGGVRNLPYRDRARALSMWQNLASYLIVAVAAAWVAWSVLLPRAWRDRVRAR